MNAIFHTQRTILTALFSVFLVACSSVGTTIPTPNASTKVVSTDAAIIITPTSSNLAEKNDDMAGGDVQNSPDASAETGVTDLGGGFQYTDGTIRGPDGNDVTAAPGGIKPAESDFSGGFWVLRSNGTPVGLLYDGTYAALDPNNEFTIGGQRYRWENFSQVTLLGEVASASVTDLGGGYVWDGQKIRNEAAGKDIADADEQVIGSDGSVFFYYQGKPSFVKEANGSYNLVLSGFTIFDHELYWFDGANFSVKSQALNASSIERYGDRYALVRNTHDTLVRIVDLGQQAVYEVLYGRDVVINNVHYQVTEQGLVDVRSLGSMPDYGLEAVYTETVADQFMGVPVSLEIAIDRSLSERDEKPVNKVFLNPKYRDPDNKEKSPSEAIAEATLRALYYAWRDNDPDLASSRQSVGLEQWLTMVAEYREGRRPLEDVGLLIWANDPNTLVYDPVPWRNIDPTKPIRLILMDRTPNKLVYDNLPSISRSGGPAYGTVIQTDGSLVIWSYFRSYPPRYSAIASDQLIMGLNRLSFQRQYQLRDALSIPSSFNYVDFHGDVWKSLAYLIGENFWRGALTVTPADLDQ